MSPEIDPNIVIVALVDLGFTFMMFCLAGLASIFAIYKIGKLFFTQGEK